MSYSCGGILPFLFYLPMSAISLLKLPPNIYVWFGCAVISSSIVCCMMGISLKSSLCDGMYVCIISQDCSGWFFNMCIICKYGDIFIGDGIFVMLLGNAYLLFISVNSSPLAGIYGIL